MRQTGIIRLTLVLSIVAGLIALADAVITSNRVVAPAYFVGGEQVGQQIYYAWAFFSVFIPAFVSLWLLLSLLGWAIKGFSH